MFRLITVEGDVYYWECCRCGKEIVAWSSPPTWCGRCDRTPTKLTIDIEKDKQHGE